MVGAMEQTYELRTKHMYDNPPTWGEWSPNAYPAEWVQIAFSNMSGGTKITVYSKALDTKYQWRVKP